MANYQQADLTTRPNNSVQRQAVMAMGIFSANLKALSPQAKAASQATASKPSDLPKQPI